MHNCFTALHHSIAPFDAQIKFLETIVQKNCVEELYGTIAYHWL